MIKFALVLAAFSATSACSKNECSSFPGLLSKADRDFAHIRKIRISDAHSEKIKNIIENCHKNIKSSPDYFDIEFVSTVKSSSGKIYFIYKSSISSDRFLIFRKNKSKTVVDKVFEGNPNEI